LLFLLVGPGVLVMLGENDGPSMLSYAATGAGYGIGFFLPFVLLTFVLAFVVQEAALRVGIGSQCGHAELIWQRYGPGWGGFAVADLVLGNLLTLISEFVAIAAGARYFGISPPYAVAAGAAIILAALLSRRYRTWERTTLIFALGNLLFIPVAIASHPDAGAVARTFVTWQPLHTSGHVAAFVTLLMANIGATVTPWMLFFQQSAVVDKGLMRADLRFARIDTAIGTGIAALVAIAAIIATAPLFEHGIDTSKLSSPADFATSLRPYVGRFAASLFALGMIEAGIVAAMTISTSSSYALAEVTRRGSSLNLDFTEGWLFYLSSIVSVAIAGGVVLIPGMPLLAIAIAVNVIATLFMPPALLFIIVLAGDREVVGDLASSPRANAAICAILACITLCGALYSLTVVFPKLGPQ
jgi:Mn2+/Fe2+ NRAMP family transporter